MEEGKKGTKKEPSSRGKEIIPYFQVLCQGFSRKNILLVNEYFMFILHKTCAFHGIPFRDPKLMRNISSRFTYFSLYIWLIPAFGQHFVCNIIIFIKNTNEQQKIFYNITNVIDNIYQSCYNNITDIK